MKEPMYPKLRAQLLERLSHRAARLAAVTAATHPGSSIDAVIAIMAEHVTRTAMVLLGEAFTREVLSSIFDNVAEGYGICRFCHARPLREDRTMCQFCWDQAVSDDEMTDEEFVAMGLDDGGADERKAGG